MIDFTADPALPFGRLRWLSYNKIYVDPPWAYATRSEKGQERSASKHYGTMTLEQMKATPVLDLASPLGCLLAMWVTDTHIDQSFELIRWWGFDFKTVGFVWIKTNPLDEARIAEIEAAMQAQDLDLIVKLLTYLGMGHYTRANPEICIFATHGAPSRLEGGGGVRQVIFAERREHSRKPDGVRGVELFSRLGDQDGWDAAGLEAGMFS